MGGIEDVEPPLKRIKDSLGELNSFFEKSSNIKLITTSLGDSMARILPAQGDDEMVGLKGVIRKNEFLKIITRALYSLGYDKTGALLEEESGITLHPSKVTSLMQLVLDGKWDDSITILSAIGVSVEIEKFASFIMLEQKFLELLKCGNTTDALLTLRNEISPLRINMNRVHQLASSLISHSQSISPSIETISASSRSDIQEKLQKLLPAAMIVPERRLEHLVEQALGMQRESCVFHNTLDGELSLYTDHQCGRSQIPSETVQVYVWHQSTGDLLVALPGHAGAVNCVSWNPCNLHMLASASDDRTIRIWGLGHLNLKCKGIESNDFIHQSNGKR